MTMCEMTVVEMTKEMTEDKMTTEYRQNNSPQNTG